jgi:hypothetical protein
MIEIGVVSAFLDSDGPVAVLFDRLKQSLTEKYGKPSDQDDKTESHLTISDRRRTVCWSFPSTSITLEWTEFERGSNHVRDL